jgi:hypothetical protein
VMNAVTGGPVSKHGRRPFLRNRAWGGSGPVTAHSRSVGLLAASSEMERTGRCRG